MKLTPESKELSTRLGHAFSRPELLIQALTHSSLATPGREDYQRLEFLGDRVLGLVIAEALVQNDASASEGELAPRLNALVRKETCADVAAELDIGAALLMGRSESLSGGRRKIALLGDAMEAVIAAIYLDAGFDVVRERVLAFWGSRIATAEALAVDPKSALQEWAQARGMPPPSYVETNRTGPDHAPTFTIEVQLQNGKTASATAPSKRAAQQAAAQTLFDMLGNLNDD